MLPKYEKIKQDIILAIESGEFAPGDRIYSEGDLKKKYSVSNTTVVKALNDLVNDGYLIRRQGEGTFVRKNLKHRKVLFSELAPLVSIANENTKKSVEKTVTIIAETIQDETISLALGDSKGAEGVIKISQIALVNEKPWKIQNRYVLSNRLNQAALQRLEQGASLSKELDLGVNMTSLPMKMFVNLITVTKDSEIVEPLNKIHHQFDFKEELALFEITKTTYEQTGEPVEYSRSFIHPDYYSIELTSYS